MTAPNVVCVKVGTRYGPEYVNRLATAVRRHLIRPHRFLCLTDRADGLLCDWAYIGTDAPGWWAKMILFAPHPELEDQRTVFLDLDTVIVGNIDFLLDYEGPFAILRDFYDPGGWGSAVMSIAPGIGLDVFRRFEADRDTAIQSHWGDQQFIQNIMGKADLWQELYPGRIVSYKVHCQDGIPKEARLICFHGQPKPHDLPADDPVHKIWEDGCLIAS